MSCRLYRRLVDPVLALGRHRWGHRCGDSPAFRAAVAMKTPTVMAAPALLLSACVVPTTEDPSAQEPLTFLCDRSDTVVVSFSGERALLKTDQAEVEMTSQPVASGFAYSGGGQSIRGKGPELTWTRADGTTRSCREQEWAMRQPQIQPPASPLTDTRWTLVGFQSSDDAIGTVVPPNPERYVLSFGADGRIAAQLDCNRALATWQASSQSETGGSLTIMGGPMTRAMCAPGAMDTRIASDFGRIRSYTLQGGRLFLALEADAGVYEFRPTED